MTSGIGLWVLIALGLAVGVGVLFIVRRQRYLARLRALGWSHDSRPGLGDIADLNAPPFALGLSRSVDELVSGTTPSGFGFRSFTYDYRGAGPTYAGRLACLRLPYGLPTAFITGTDDARDGIAPSGIDLFQAQSGDVRVISTDADYAEQLLETVGEHLAGLRQVAGTIDLSVDGNHLVATSAPRNPEALSAFLGALEPVAHALAGSTLRGREIAVGPAGPSFYGHPDWEFGDADPGLLQLYPVTEAGSHHEVKEHVCGSLDGIRMDAFVHEWTTTRIETYTDGQGHVQTRTVTDHHSEVVCGFVLPFDLPTLSVNGRRVGRKVRFESTDFNDAFTVRTDDPKFASDVIHPRTMEWLLAARPPGWTVFGPLVVFEVGEHDLLLVDRCEATLRGWLGRIPRFVWSGLGQPAPPYLVE